MSECQQCCCSLFTCVFCWLDGVDFKAEGPERDLLVRRIYWVQVVLTLLIIAVSGVLIVMQDFIAKLVLGIVNSLLAAALKFSTSFHKDLSDTTERLESLSRLKAAKADELDAAIDAAE